MEINARVYVMADSPELLRQACEALERQMEQSYYGAEALEPSAALPLSRTWYGFSASTVPTSAPEREDGWWDDGLRRCAMLLKKRGAVVVEFWSPDYPDEGCGYAHTTPQGDVEMGGGCSLYSYKRALGCDDVKRVYMELASGRTRRQRDAAASRMERQARLRREKGDFEVVDGVLKKYRGMDENVVIPEGVTEIGEFAFVDEDGWKRMLLDDEAYDAPPVETLVIPDGVRRIGTYALAYCGNIREVSIPNSVTEIGERAFEGCEALERVKLPEGLRAVGDSVFFLCESLRSVAFPEGLEEIGPNAFNGCDGLARITLPRELKRIGDCAFIYCKSLKEIAIPEGVEEIGESAFGYCDRLERAALPRGLKRLGNDAFKGCRRLRDAQA